jgi:hypothetical protein
LAQAFKLSGERFGSPAIYEMGKSLLRGQKNARFMSGLKTIFLEENSGDRFIMLRRDIFV